MTAFPEPSEQNAYLVDHVNRLRASFRHYLGRDLITGEVDDREVARSLYHAPFVLVSHDMAADPVFNYGNQAAQALFELTWAELTTMPSRQSAEPPNREARSQLLQAVSTQGFIEHYSGVRIAKSGRRFQIEDVTVWNLLDESLNYYGQAAVYSHWTYLTGLT